jgi:hypothetical protein
MMSGVFGLTVATLCLSGTGQAAQAVSSIKPSYTEPAWKVQIAASRFVVLSDWASEAVLDRENGLVWELSPAKDTFNWAGAQEHCLNRSTGGRKGWRLPTVHELASLIDPSIAPPGPTLRAGHPFTNIQSARYWSVAPNLQYAAPPWFVIFSNGRPVRADQKADSGHVWCVRTAGYELNDN